MARLKVAALISGRGSNMQALQAACAQPDFPAELALVLSNRADAAGLAFAADRGIATALVDHRKRTREDFDAEIDTVLRAHGIEAVCLAGFMRLLTPGFVRTWFGRMLNIHPSLLPAFKGLHTHERALATGVRFTGCTVHFVVPEMDDGPIIIQAAVPVAQDDTPEALGARVLAAEHRIYPQALRWLAEGRLKIEGDVVRVADAGAPADGLLNPV